MGKHTVPQMYLRSFSIDGERREIYQKLRNEEPKSIPIERAAVSDIYTDEIERRLASLEGASDSILKQIISERSISRITDDNKRTLSEFMHTMRIRTLPNLSKVTEYSRSDETKHRLAADLIEADEENQGLDVLLGIVKYVRDENVETDGLVQITDGKILIPDDKKLRLKLAMTVVEHAIAQNWKDFSGNAFNDIIFGLKHHETIIEIIACSPWVLLGTGDGMEFITSNNPVITYSGVAKRDFEMFMPVSPKLALYVSRTRPDELQITHLSNQWVRHLNALVFQQSRIVFGATIAPLLAPESKHLRLTKPSRPFVKGKFAPIPRRLRPVTGT